METSEERSRIRKQRERVRKKKDIEEMMGEAGEGSDDKEESR